MSQARLREALTAGGPNSKEKGPPVADGILTVTPDAPEAIEWRTRQSLVDSIASNSKYLTEDDDALHPSELYGKFTWKINNFNQSSKRELRSNTFEVGGFKWYILVYPQGCDVANHLSLFLCVADYDKLLPGWSHFAQFTIAVVNKDPKKSKYSDTLHRFCKKEHDWGWKKFMELGKVAEGFIVNDQMVIKAQVQVIKDRPSSPFRTLDAQYRRELLRVYLTNVEGLVKRFVDEKREYLNTLLVPERGFAEFWKTLDDDDRLDLSTEQAAVIFKGLTKRFFNDKEVTSTLVMDGVYCGAKFLEDVDRVGVRGETSMPDCGSSRVENSVLVDASRGIFHFGGDVLATLQRIASETVPANTSEKPADGGASQRHAQDGDEYSREAVERDEKRLVDLGRRTVEVFAAAHIASTYMETALVEAETIRRQEELIREVEELSREEQERMQAKQEAEKEKRARKKERQKKKKDAERAKREAEDAERQRIEQERREEKERKQREADEKRRKEEEAREIERQKALAIAKQQAETRKAQEAAGKAAAKAAKQAALKEQQQQQAASSGKSSDADGSASAASSQQHSITSSFKTTDTTPPTFNNTTTDNVVVPDSATNGGGGGASGRTSNASSRPESARDATPDALALSAAAAVNGQAPTAMQGGQGPSSSTATSEADVVSPRLQALLAQKDAEIAALKSRVGELEAQLAAVSLSSRPGSAPPVGSSAGSMSASSSVSSSFALSGAGGGSASHHHHHSHQSLTDGNGSLSAASSRSSSRAGLAPAAPHYSVIGSGGNGGGVAGKSPSSSILASASLARQRASAPPPPGYVGGGGPPQQQTGPSQQQQQQLRSVAAAQQQQQSPQPSATQRIYTAGLTPAGTHTSSDGSSSAPTTAHLGGYRAAAMGVPPPPAMNAGGGGLTAGNGSLQGHPDHPAGTTSTGSMFQRGGGNGGGARPGSAAAATSGSGANGPPGAPRAFSSPLPNNNTTGAGGNAAGGNGGEVQQGGKRLDGLGGSVLESPGLDDFAHMGLITDLLE